MPFEQVASLQMENSAKRLLQGLEEKTADDGQHQQVDGCERAKADGIDQVGMEPLGADKRDKIPDVLHKNDHHVFREQGRKKKIPEKIQKKQKER